MQSSANSPQEYIDELPEDRKEAILKIRKVIRENIPCGFEETISYGMLAFSVPHSLYPPGYHCKPDEPLPFISLASQRHFIGLYHMGIYSDEKLLDWFKKEYAKRCRYKLDMGKSCIRLKHLKDIPYDLIGELSSKITVEQWIARYESYRNK
ncbi:MAG: DUF1801 domain-containing protein [Spirochaetaceae bacterium]|nr:DUF1801 domain-containing protein [Spirochaetaceae bacterium]